MKEAGKFISQIEEKAGEWDISAVLSVQDKDGVRYDKAFGYADREEKRKLTLSDRFCLSAHNGFFLTLCVMHLVDRKKLRLRDRVSRFIPEYKHGEQITVLNLLRWRSGIEDYWRGVRMVEIQKDPAHAALSDRERFRREFELYAQDVDFKHVLKLVGELDLKHAPGVEDDGSAGTLPFISEIVSRVSGLTPREYLFRHFFEPLGMDDTRPGDDATTEIYGMFRDTELIRLPRVRSDSTFSTTAQDMNLLVRALAGKGIFSEGTWARMLKCNNDMLGLGFIKQGELYCADFFLNKLRDTCQILLDFEDGTSILMLNNEEQRYKLDDNRRWRCFATDLRRAWQDTRVYPQNPELKRVNGKNVWDAMDIELLPQQLEFVPECSRCAAAMLAQKQPVYVLMDHGLAIGMAALTIKPKKNEYAVSFLQVDHRYQGRGYGRILLTRAMEILKEKGARTLKIGVNRFNIPARRLYQSVGFEDKEIYDEFIDMKITL